MGTVLNTKNVGAWINGQPVDVGDITVHVDGEAKESTLVIDGNKFQFSGNINLDVSQVVVYVIRDESGNVESVKFVDKSVFYADPRRINTL